MLPAPLPADGPVREWRPRGTALVTGGTGLLGGILAQWLARNGVEHLVLTSRRGADAPGAAELRAELEELGARVTVAACDVTDRAALASLIEGLDAAGEDIRAVFHTAVRYELGALADTTLDQYANVVDAKITGARILAELLGERELDAFVVYSSVAALWGSGDHGAYSAANAHLDAWALGQRARGVPVTAVAWGIWDAVNERDSEDAAERPVLNRRAQRQGLPLIDPELALTAFQQVEDQLALLSQYGEAAASERRATEAAQRSLDLASNRYREGVASYLDVVTAQTANLQARRNALDLATRQRRASVQLVRALGGGWDGAELTASEPQRQASAAP